MDLGAEVDPGLLTPGTIPLPRADGDAVVAEVLWVDRFGNCQLNLGPDDLEEFEGFKDVDRVSLRLGDPTAPTGVAVRTAVRIVELRRHRRRHRAGARLVRHAGDLPRSPLGRRRAGHRPRRPDRDRRRSPTSRAATASGSRWGRRADRVSSIRGMRPATTLTLALLLVVILVAGLISLARL